MAMPTIDSIGLPLLRVIADAGGELPVREAIRRVMAFFPDLTEEDMQRRQSSGRARVIENRIQWKRLQHVHDGYLYREPLGLWRITPQGRAYLEEHWPGWRPRYSVDSGTERGPIRPTNGAEQGDTQPPPVATVQRPHERFKELLLQTGHILGYHTESEFREGPYVYDVVWKTFPQAPRAGCVFEVQDRGNLIEALAKLQHAKDAWGSRLFLVVVGERDRQRIDQLVAPLLAGTFHRLARDLVVLTPQQVEDVYEALNRIRDLLRRLLLE